MVSKLKHGRPICHFSRQFFFCVYAIRNRVDCIQFSGQVQQTPPYLVDAAFLKRRQQQKPTTYFRTQRTRRCDARVWRFSTNKYAIIINSSLNHRPSPTIAWRRAFLVLLIFGYRSIQVIWIENILSYLDWTPIGLIFFFVVASNLSNFGTNFTCGPQCGKRCWSLDNPTHLYCGRVEVNAPLLISMENEKLQIYLWFGFNHEVCWLISRLRQLKCRANQRLWCDVVRLAGVHRIVQYYSSLQCMMYIFTYICAPNA